MTDIVRAEDYQGDGLEDFDEENFVMPRININHADAVFEDGLSGETFESKEVILLGMIRQRILFPAEMKEGGSDPLCRSFDAKVGYPGEEYPWEASGFAKQNGPLSCADCALKDWGSHPNRDAPWCTEQYKLPLLFQAGVTGVWTPAVTSMQRAGLPPARSYLTSFKRAGEPLYACRTTLSLEARKRGSVRYAVPNFVRGEATSVEDWPRYADQYRRIRDYLHEVPRSFLDDTAALPASEATNVVPPDDDDLL